MRTIPRLKDLTGKTFERLKVLNREENNKHGQTMWRCECNCGKILIIRGYSLVTGNTKSCGCAKTDMLIKRNKELGKKKRIDETGNKYGKLLVKELDEEKTNGSQNAWWLCTCECGNSTSVMGVDLRRSHVMSCGCLKSQGEQKILMWLIENNIDYIYQHSFSDLYIQDLLKFDFAILNKAKDIIALIEYDGIQHFSPTKYFGEQSYLRTKESDSLKNKYCKEKQIKLIRIKYNEDLFSILEGVKCLI